MAGLRLDLPRAQVFDSNSKVRPGAKLYVYQNESTTKIDLFSDRDCTVTETNPVVADSAGTLNLPYTRYTGLMTLVLKTSADVLVWSEDDVGLRPETTGSDVSLAFKNALNNGGFTNWTGGSSFANISGAGAAVEVADDWFFAQAGTASNAVSRQTAASSATRYGLRMGRPAASVQTGKLRLFQALTTDDAYRMRGKKVTVSFSLQAGADFSGTNVAILIATGTTEGEAASGIDGGSWGGQINALSETQAPVTTATRYEFTPSSPLSGSLKECGLQLAYTPTGTAGSNDWIQIEDVQWEVAETATDFASRPEPIEYLLANLTTAGRALIAAASGQIIFPATQNASANANTLDDYEEGTWTPVLTFATPGNLAVTYSVQVGTYVKIGRSVTVTFGITTSAFTHTTAAGALQVTGLPVTPQTLSNYNAIGGLFWSGVTKAGYTDYHAQASSNSAILTFVASGTGVAGSAVDFTYLPTGGTVVLRSTITYDAPT